MNCLLCQSQQIDQLIVTDDRHFGLTDYFACPVCSLIFLSPEDYLSRKEEKARYELHRNNPEDKDYVNFLRRLIDPLSAKLTEGMQGLDYGCGPGPAISAMFEKRGMTVSNFDPFYFPDMKLLSRQYDFITSTEVVEHFHKPRQEFEQFSRLLGKNGILGLMTKIWRKTCAFSDWHYRRDPTHVCFYQEQTFEYIADWLSWSVEFYGEDVVVFTDKTNRNHKVQKSKGLSH